MTTRSRKNWPSAREVLKSSSTSPNAKGGRKEAGIEVNLSLSQQGRADAAVSGAASQSQYVDAAIYELKKTVLLASNLIPLASSTKS